MNWISHFQKFLQRSNFHLVKKLSFNELQCKRFTSFIGRGYLPVDIILVRHGESEGNVAQRLSKNGDERHWLNPDFKKRHTSNYRLTDLGRKQSQSAGEWIKKNFSETFDSYYVSDYVRARETAAMLNLPNALWKIEFYLREKDKGVLARSSYKDRLEDSSLKSYIKHLEDNPFYGEPPGGESIASICLRLDFVMQIWRHLGIKSLIAVCHGNVMMGFRVRIERMDQERFIELEESQHTFDEIYNGQILHYTRRNPHTGVISTYPIFMRSICPWDTSLSSNKWYPIIRPTYTNDQLLQKVVHFPQLVNNDTYPKKN